MINKREFYQKLNANNNICLANHRVYDRYVLPLDAFLEIIAAGLINTLPSLASLSLQDIKLTELAASNAEDENIALRTTLNDAVVSIDLKKEGQYSCLFNAKIISDMYPWLETSTNGAFSKIISAAEIYQKQHSQIGSFYRSIQEIRLFDTHADITLNSSLPDASKKNFIFDPTIFNAAITAIINIAASAQDSTILYLPYHIEHITILRKFDSTNYRMTCVTKDKTKYDAIVRNENGQPVIIAHGVTLRPYNVPARANIVQEATSFSPIAIIGFSGQFPGAIDCETYWKNLLSGVISVGSPPSTRQIKLISQKELECGFLQSVDTFDARFFNLSGQEITACDPQQRLFLETAYQAMESSGYANSKDATKRCSIFVGTTTGDYQQLLENEIIPQAFWGNAPSVTASRIAYHLDLHGSAIAIDTACSSSLMAIHLACKQLQQGDCDFAIAGGVFIMNSDEFTTQAKRANMLSKENRCKVFDKDADGFVPGEAVGALVLKRLDQALADRDFIHATIISSVANQDGYSNGITAPNYEAQKNLVIDAYRNAGINPETISYIEAHGTGTSLGDPIEVNALTAAFSEFTNKQHFCALGSVKANIGHAATAAGVAGLIKCIMMLKHGEIPPNPLFKVANPEIKLTGSPFYVNADKQLCGEIKRTAISSFGFSGTNVHIVLQQAPEQLFPVETIREWPFAFSALSKKALVNYLIEFKKYLLSSPITNRLQDISYNVTCLRKQFKYRCLFIAKDLTQLLRLIDDYLENEVNVPISSLQFSQIGQKFLAGENVGWLEYYQAYLCYKIPLPTYSFDRERYWPKNNSILELRISQEDYFIRDHVVSGKSILPAVAYLQLLLKTIDAETLILQNVIWQKALVVNKSEAIVRISHEKNTFSFTENENILCSGNIIEAKVFQAKLDIVTSKDMRKMDGNSVYQLLLQQGLTYGSTLRVIQELYFTATEVNAILVSTVRTGDSRVDAISILDGALQATCVLNQNATCLPFAVEKVIFYKTIIPYACQVNVKKLPGSNAKVVYYDITIISNEGEILISFHNLAARVINKHLVNDYQLMTQHWKQHSQPILKSLDDSVFLIGYDPLLNRQPFVSLQNIEQLFEKERVPKYIILLAQDKTEKLYDLESVFRLTQLLFSKRIKRIRLVYVCHTQHADLPIQSAVKGYINSLKHEIPQYEFIYCEVAQNCWHDIAALLQQTLQAEIPKGAIRYTENECSSYDLSPCDLSETMTGFIRQGIYVIVGGFGGIGKNLIRYLRNTYDATLVVIGRSPEEKNTEYDYYRCDITNAEQLKIVFDSIIKRYPKINGILNLAGVLKDAFIIKQPLEDFRAVLQTKILGTINLDIVTASLKIDFFILFSSLSSVLGNLGQVAYAAGNAFLNEFASYRNRLARQLQRSGSTISIAWPLWDEGGMGIDEKTRLHLQERWGVLPLATEAGLHLLEKILKSGNEQVICYPARQRMELDAKSITSIAPINAEVTPYTANINSTATIDLLIQLFALVVKLRPDQIDPSLSFDHYGLDSLLLIEYLKRLEPHFGNLPKTLLFEYQTIAVLASYFEQSKIEQAIDIVSIPEKSEINNRDIAIIGIAGKYPQAENLEQFWQNLLDAKDCIEDISMKRSGEWPYRYAGLIDKMDHFDPLFFNISPSDAARMDPQERQFLEIVYIALEDAGYSYERLKLENNAAVFVGAMYGLYENYGVELSSAKEPVIANSTYASIANRVSYHFNLHGPSMAIDTMCSSSLSAIHLACLSLQSGEAEIAIAGGVNIISHPYKYAELLQKNFLASDGHCHSFSTGGDGYVPGEGVGAIILKPLTKAVADNDFIYAVIKASGVNHDGRTHGYTVPNVNAQADLINRVLKNAKINMSDLSYIEAHGTGTPLGDPIEVRAIEKAIPTITHGNCYLGSVKANIGHLEGAAGIAALTKVILQMKHQKIVKQPLFSEINPELVLDKIGLIINQETIAWHKPKKVAAISSFGAGGSNAHLILENYIVTTKKTNPQAEYLYCMGAKSSASLRQKCYDLIRYLQNDETIHLADLSYTLNNKRNHFSFRCTFIASNVQELQVQLQQYINDPINYSISSRNNSLLKIAENYIKGDSIDWSHVQAQGNLLHLPSYPFEREAYWVKKTESNLSLYTKSWTNASLSERLPQVNCKFLLLAPVESQRLFRLEENPAITVINFYQLQAVDLVDYINLNNITGIIDFTDFRIEQNDEPSCDEKKLSWLQAMVKFSKGKIKYYLHFTNNITQNLAGHFTLSLLQAIAAEQWLFNIKSIDCEDISFLQQRWVSIVNDEIANNDAFHVLYKNGQRFIVDWQKKPLLNSNAPFKIDPNKAWIISGGTSGIGARLAQTLVIAGVKKLILLGRTALPEEHQWQEMLQNEKISPKTKQKIALLHGLKAQGALVAYYSGSLSDSQRLKIFISEQRQLLGAFAGFIHCAGLTEMSPKPFSLLQYADFQAMFEPKLLGLYALYQILKAESLDFILLFSSISSVMSEPARGISHYATANGMMNYYADFLNNNQQANICCVQWPLWLLDNEQAFFDSRYITTKPITAEQGILLFKLLFMNRVIGNKLVLDSTADENTKSLLMPKHETKAASANSGVVQSIPSETKTLSWLKAEFSAVLNIPIEKLNEDSHFTEFGIDSIIVMEIVDHFEKRLGSKIAPSVFLDNPTLTKLAAYLSKNNLHATNISPTPSAKDTAVCQKIAIIGLACHFPGARNSEEFWGNIASGVCSVQSKEPFSSLQCYRYANDDPAYVAGRYVNDIRYFDPNFFRMDSESSAQLDPLVRQFLEVSVEAIAHSGYELNEYDNKEVGVFVGARAANYVEYIQTADKNTIGSIGQNFIAAHVSKFLNIHGPSLVVDTACSSSLASIHLASQHLLNNQIDYAIAGGVEVLLDERPYKLLQATGALSPTGKCRPFDKNADGLVLGEGAGAVILKRLDDAIADKDSIYAVIDITMMNNDGQTMGLTTPNPQAQAQLIRKALQRSGISATEISYLEAHATGTQLGDPTELAAIKQAFQCESAPLNYCAVGSVKANIGHLLSAAGIASFIKTTLAISHQYLPPLIHCEEPNKRFELSQSPFTINHVGKTWENTKGIRKACINAFGFGGTNVHVILSELDSEVFPNYVPIRVPLAYPCYQYQLCWAPKIKIEKTEQEAFDEFFEPEIVTS